MPAWVCFKQFQTTNTWKNDDAAPKECKVIKANILTYDTYMYRVDCIKCLLKVLACVAIRKRESRREGESERARESEIETDVCGGQTDDFTFWQIEKFTRDLLFL